MKKYSKKIIAPAILTVLGLGCIIFANAGGINAATVDNVQTSSITAAFIYFAGFMLLITAIIIIIFVLAASKTGER